MLSTTEDDVVSVYWTASPWGDPCHACGMRLFSLVSLVMLLFVRHDILMGDVSVIGSMALFKHRSHNTCNVN